MDNIPDEKIIPVHGTLGRVECEFCKAEMPFTKFQDKLENSIKDIGVMQQYELYNHLIKTNNDPVVLDSSILLKNPKEILTILCDKLEISYSNKMLKWSEGPKKADGIWAKYWYKNVHNSNGFNNYEIKDFNLNTENEMLAQDCEKYYNFLFSKSITI